MDSEALQQIQQELFPSEKVLWAGRPSNSLLLLLKHPLVFFLTLGAAMGLAGYSLYRYYQLEELLSFMIGAIPLAIFMTILILVLMGLEVYERSQTFYGVTNWRVLEIHTTFGRAVTALSIKNLPTVEWVNSHKKWSEIRFGFPDKTKIHITPPLVFKHLTNNAEEAHQHILDLVQRAQRPELGPIKPLPFEEVSLAVLTEIKSGCHAAEDLLWAGTPQMRYWLISLQHYATAFTAVAALMTMGIILSGFPWIFWIFGGIAILQGIYLPKTYESILQNQPPALGYGLTNKRILFVRNAITYIQTQSTPKRELLAELLTTLGPITIVYTQHGGGSLHFRQAPIQQKNKGQELALKNIPEVRRVYEMIYQAQHL